MGLSGYSAIIVFIVIKCIWTNVQILKLKISPSMELVPANKRLKVSAVTSRQPAIQTSGAVRTHVLSKRTGSCFACYSCRLSRTKCNEFRPCSRCQRTGNSSSCTYIVLVPKAYHFGLLLIVDFLDPRAILKIHIPHVFVRTGERYNFFFRLVSRTSCPELIFVLFRIWKILNKHQSIQYASMEHQSG
jgi:hypothetical protein